MSASPRFSNATLEFIAKASRQKRPDWLDRNRDEYESAVLEPLKNLARQLKAKLGPVAPGYHFPQKGIGRLKRSAYRAQEYGGLFKNWVAYSASRPSSSRFDHNPNLYFLLQPGEPDGDEVLLAGGLYVPSSRQTRAIREAIANDASEFDRLFKTKAFSSRFAGGFSPERISKRPPRGFDVNHPRMDWLKLQGFFVWRSYTQREFASKDFAELLASDCSQILKLNALLELALEGRLGSAKPCEAAAPTGLSTRLEDIQAPRRKMDF
jgi:uncharacterized protein (TIGR02453 family)